jgi:hypothetical protein
MLAPLADTPFESRLLSERLRGTSGGSWVSRLALGKVISVAHREVAMFGRRRLLQKLREERKGLEAKIDLEADELVRNRATPDELVERLTPLTRQAVELDARILEMTPWREVQARRRELKMLAMSPTLNRVDASRIRGELSKLEVRTSARRRPLTLRSFLGLLGLVALMSMLREAYRLLS